MKPVISLLSSALLVMFLLIQGVAIRAGSDHDDAASLRDSGDILPLEQILEKIRRSYPGKILEVKLATESDQKVYNIEMLNDKGIVRRLIIDAGTGDLLRNEGEK